jgi:hypothetical protein
VSEALRALASLGKLDIVTWQKEVVKGARRTTTEKQGDVCVVDPVALDGGHS